MKVTVLNRQSAMPVPEGLLGDLARTGREALRLIDSRGWAHGKIPVKATVLLVDDVMIAEVHGQYMDDPTPTDVITFPYGNEGDILISVETAEAQRGDYGNTWEEEVALYLLHGLLHLCGHDDREDAERARMASLQARLLREVFRPGGGGD